MVICEVVILYFVVHVKVSGSILFRNAFTVKNIVYTLLRASTNYVCQDFVDTANGVHTFNLGLLKYSPSRARMKFYSAKGSS